MMRLKEVARRLWSQAGLPRGIAPSLMEALEPRMVLAGVPFPDISELIDPRNTVVRFEFNVGAMDVEFFDVAGPNGSPPAINTVNHILAQIREGLHDESFVHRFAIDPTFNVNFVVQGGGFKFTDVGGLTEITTDTVDNEFHAGRSNLQWTMALAQRGGDPNSGTSQWFINMVDNEFLDNQLFTVFGRLVGETGGNDRNFNVARTIANRNFPGPPPPDPTFVFADVMVDNEGKVTSPFTPLPGGNPLSLALTEVPVVEVPPSIPPGQLRSTAMMERYLVKVLNIEIIKPKDFDTFYEHVVVSPEGYRGPTVIETLDLVNINVNDTASYQIIVRYERADRDTVILTGTLAPNEHRRIKVSDFNDGTLDLVRPHTPYSLEVQSTHDVGAQITRTDFGATASETLINIRLLSDVELMRWEFGGPAVADISPTDPGVARTPFLLYTGLTGMTTTVTTTFFRESASPVTITKVLGPYRRGGLELFSIQGLGSSPITGVLVEADHPIATMLSVYEQHVLAGTPPTFERHASTTQGTPGGGIIRGALAAAAFDDEGEAYISVLNSNSTAAVVTFQFRRTNGQVLLGNLIIPPETRRTFNLRSAGVPSQESFSITYTSGATPVTATYVSTAGGERVSTPFARYASSLWTFAGGTFDPSNNNQEEFITVYNPFVSPTVRINLHIFFYFAGATNNRIDLVPAEFELLANERVDISVRDLVSIVAKINEDPLTFGNYSISILGVGTDTQDPPFTAPIVAQIHNYTSGTTRSWSSIGTAGSELFPMTDPRFIPGTGT